MSTVKVSVVSSAAMVTEVSARSSESTYAPAWASDSLTVSALAGAGSAVTVKLASPPSVTGEVPAEMLSSGTASSSSTATTTPGAPVTPG